jgi:hypothetical protein
VCPLLTDSITCSCLVLPNTYKYAEKVRVYTLMSRLVADLIPAVMHAHPNLLPLYLFQKHSEERFCLRPCRTIRLDLGETCRALLLVAEFACRNVPDVNMCRMQVLRTRHAIISGGGRHTIVDVGACIRAVALLCALAGQYY